MTNTNNKIRAVVLAALMVLSVFAGTVAFAGTASANVTGLSNPSVADVPAGSSGTTQSVTVDVATDASSGNTVTLSYTTGVITGASVNSIADTRTATVTGTTATSVTVNIDDGTADGADTGTLDLTVTHNLDGVSPQGPSTVTFSGSPGGASDVTDNFDITPASNTRNTPLSGETGTVFLGEEDINLVGVNGIDSGTDTFTATSGDQEGQIANIDNALQADITSTNNFVAGTAYNASGNQDGNADLSVIEPQISDLTIYNGGSVDNADVTDGSINSDETQITLTSEWNFRAAEDLSITIEDDDGLEVQSGLTGVSDIGQTGDPGAVTISDVDSLDTGEYTVTVEGVDDLDGTSRSATFTIRDEAQTITLSEGTITQGDSTIATVTGTPGQVGLVRIAADDLDTDVDTVNTDAADVFSATGDVVDRVGTDDLTSDYNNGQNTSYVGAFVDLDDAGQADVRINSEFLDTATVDVEFFETANNNQGLPGSLTQTNQETAFAADEDETGELTVDEQTVNITSAPSVVRIGEDFTVEGTAPEADAVKAYARIDQDWVPLDEDDTNFAEDDSVDADGSFSIDIDSGSEIDLPDSYRIGVVADPSVGGTSLISSDAGSNPNSRLNSTTWGDFDTTETFTVRTVEGDLTAQLSSSSIAADEGDEVTLSGTALGQGDSVRVYIIGPRGSFYNENGEVTQSRSFVDTVSVDEEEFDEEYSFFDTRGEWTFIIGGQGRDGEFADDNSEFNPVDSQQAGQFDGLPTGLTTQQAIEIVEDEHTGAGSDDQIVVLTLQAENPQLTIEDFTTDGQVAQGEVTISGTSNREDETTVFVEALGQNENVVASSEAEVNGTENEWETTLDMSDVETGTYTLRADDDSSSAELEFELVSELSTPTETPAPETETEAPETETEMPETDTPAPETDTPAPETTTTSTSTPGFGAIVALVALIAAALLAIRRD